MSAPESWKTKCSIRRVDDVAMTESGTLILHRDSLPPRRALSETRPLHPTSLAPFAIDIFDEEDHLPPARNSDVLGLRLPTMEVDSGSTSRASLLAGLSAGLAAFAVFGAVAFVSLTSDYASHTAGRSPRVVARGQSTLTVAEPDLAVLKAAPPRRRAKRSPGGPRVAEEAAPTEMPAPTPESE